MTSTTMLLILSTALFVLAVVVAVVPVDDANTEAAPPHTGRFDGSHATRAAWAAGFGIVVLAVSGWVVPAIVIAAATWYWVAAFQRRDSGRSNDVERTDALASWIENLRDVLLAGDQPIGAIASTVPSAPPIIRPAVRRLSAALGHQDPDTAFRRFADELDDPLGDLVSAGLLIAVQRGARTVAVLTSLAEQARTARTDAASSTPSGSDPARGVAAVADHGRARDGAARLRPAPISTPTTRAGGSCSRPGARDLRRAAPAGAAAG